MIIKTSSNRNAIVEYLNQVSEDEFIQDVIIPFFNVLGFDTFQHLQHGPGEHGKDIVFRKYFPPIYEFEYIAVQAKAIKITTTSLIQMVDQLKRAMLIPIIGTTNGIQIKPNYAILMCAREVPNEAQQEFPNLAQNQNIRLLRQENIVDLMMDNNIIPNRLIGKLSTDNSSQGRKSPIDRQVTDVLLKDNNPEITQLFNQRLPLYKKRLSIETKEMVIEYIFKRWKDNSSWSEIAILMPWIDEFFDFIQPDQTHYLLTVIDEFLSTNPSFKAESTTRSVVFKITPEQMAQIEDQVIERFEFLIYSNNRPKAIELLELYIKAIQQTDPTTESVEKDMNLLTQYHYALQSDDQKQLKDIHSTIIEKYSKEFEN